jgi:hypothetical protein
MAALVGALVTGCLITPNDYQLERGARNAGTSESSGSGAGDNGGNGGNGASSGTSDGAGAGPDLSGGAPTAGGAPAGEGGEGQAGATGGTPGEEPVATIEPELLDDFDDNDALLPSVAGRDGFWFTDFDEEIGGTFLPVPFMPEEGATHLQSDGAYSAILGAAFRAKDPDNGDLPAPYDLSQYCGVSFRARNSELPANVITARLVDASDAVAQHGSGAQLETFWQEFVLNFSDFEPAVDFASVRSFAFVLISGGQYEFWIDDVSLLRKTSPGACPL